MKKSALTPEQLKHARETLGLTQAAMGKELDTSERFITYRESGVQPVDKMLKYAVCWLMLPKFLRERYLAKFFG